MRKYLREILRKTGLSRICDVFYVPFYNALMGPLKRRRMLSMYSKFVKKGDLCFDVGANVGSRVAVFSKLGCRVVAVEPQPACVAVLRRKFGWKDGVHIVQKAAGKKKRHCSNFCSCKPANLEYELYVS